MPEKQTIPIGTIAISAALLGLAYAAVKIFGDDDNGNGGDRPPPDIIITSSFDSEGNPKPGTVPPNWNGALWAKKLYEAMEPLNITTDSISKRHIALFTWNAFPEVAWIDVWNKFNAQYSTKRGTLWQWLDKELRLDENLKKSIRLKMNTYIPITSQLTGLGWKRGSLGDCVNRIEDDQRTIVYNF